MEVVKYLFYKGRIFIYIFVSILLSYVVSNVTNLKFSELFFLIFLELLIVRVMDDLLDYEIDIANNKYKFKRKVFSNLFWVLFIIYYLFNAKLFGVFGIYSIFIVYMTSFQNKLEVIKNFLGPISYIYYVFAFKKQFFLTRAEIILGLVLMLIALLYSFVKRRKRNVK